MRHPLDLLRSPGLPALLLLSALLETAGASAQQDRPAPLPTIDQVTARYATARGGLASWQAVHSLELSGTYTTFSIDMPFTLLRLRPDFYRFESNTLRMPFVHGHDAEGPWWVFPAYGVESAERTPPPHAGMIAHEAELEPALLRWREKGHQAEVAGRGEIDGQKTLEVKLTRQDGAVETWHLDPETFLEVAVDSTVWDLTQRTDSMPQRAYYSDFRPVEGVVLPFRIEKEYGARHTVLAVEKAAVGRADRAGGLDAARFRMPPPPAPTSSSGTASSTPPHR